MTEAEIRADLEQNAYKFIETRKTAYEGAVAEAAVINGNLMTVYQNTWNVFEAAFRNGERTAGEAPAPPMAAVIDDAGIWPKVVTGTVPVCPMPALPDLSQPEAGNIEILWNTRRVTTVHGRVEIWYTAGINDRNTNYEQETTPIAGSPDGKRHVYLRVGAAVGNGWYMQVD